jgi:hypothetical protein
VLDLHRLSKLAGIVKGIVTLEGKPEKQKYFRFKTTEAVAF